MQPQQQQQQPADMTTLAYRLSTLEQNVQQLQTELRTYVPARENELQLQSIRSTVERIESDVKEAKKQVTDLTSKQDNILISTLRYIVVTIVGLAVIVIAGVIVYFVTRPGG
jgi:hypothetical protein